ncbi:MAG: conjugative transposon protein TraN [Chitinophagaceae bacterium]|nr:conjugative transposon protein TraN [Chitinophagaceae bacterium]
MKRFVCMICVVGLFVSAKAQTKLCITTDKTTSLVFPFAIKHVDRGTASVLAQQVKEAPEILLVKAAAKDFTETNLSVITDDGSVYAFTVNYDNRPAAWVYYLPVNKTATISSYANMILDNARNTKGIKAKKYNMKAEVKGIYIKDNIIYYQLYIKNKSTVDYDIDLLRFFIKDKKKSKRTAVQEIELKPVYTTGNYSKIKGNTNTLFVVALEKFTIPDKKYLAVQLTEKNGGRHFLLRLSNKDIMQAKVLPDLK